MFAAIGIFDILRYLATGTFPIEHTNVINAINKPDNKRSIYPITGILFLISINKLVFSFFKIYRSNT